MGDRVDIILNSAGINVGEILLNINQDMYSNSRKKFDLIGKKTISKLTIAS